MWIEKLAVIVRVHANISSILSCKDLTLFKSNVPFKCMAVRGKNIYLPYFCWILMQTWAKSLFENNEHNFGNSTQIIWNNYNLKYRRIILYLDRMIKRNTLFVCQLSYETIVNPVDLNGKYRNRESIYISETNLYPNGKQRTLYEL